MASLQKTLKHTHNIDHAEQLHRPRNDSAKVMNSKTLFRTSAMQEPQWQFSNDFFSSHLSTSAKGTNGGKGKGKAKVQNEPVNPKLKQDNAVGKAGRRSKLDEEKLRLAKAISNGQLMTTRRRKVLSESSEEEDQSDSGEAGPAADLSEEPMRWEEVHEELKIKDVEDLRNFNMFIPEDQWEAYNDVTLQVAKERGGHLLDSKNSSDQLRAAYFSAQRAVAPKFIEAVRLENGMSDSRRNEVSPIQQGVQPVFRVRGLDGPLNHAAQRSLKEPTVPNAAAAAAAAAAAPQTP